MQDLSLRRLQTDTFLEFARLIALEQAKITQLFEKEEIREITPTQARVLMVLFRAKQAMTARELAGEMGVSEPTMGRFVKALSKYKWIERKRSTKDKRAFELKPTKKAYTFLPAFIRVSNQIMDDVFNGLGERELEHLKSCLDRMRANLEG